METERYCLFCDRKASVLFAVQGGLPGLEEIRFCMRCGQPLFLGIEARSLQFLAYRLDHGGLSQDRFTRTDSE